ncbi:hypothetical protein [uncultured Roseovarius sp.]|uniref:hypothetical protein n=1 Tax=uncultured Roseovarius sp. TaxID=293344 RepID=UPI000C4E9054|nr:hypothetical protein [Roseovarius sp.]MBD11567.1 hypothetical protein [Roseovarius sp.]|tara:strand:- start:150 stop:341 length:192 start_codon:yes stop_codon:yes gene_type:complete
MDILIIAVSFLSGLAGGAAGAFLVLKTVKREVKEVILRGDTIELSKIVREPAIPVVDPVKRRG